MKQTAILFAIVFATGFGTCVITEASEIESIVNALQRRQDRAKSVLVLLEITQTMEVINNRRGWRGDPTLAKDGLFTVRMLTEVRVVGDKVDYRVETPDGLRHNLSVTRRNSFNGAASYQSASAIKGGGASCIINPNPYEFGVDSGGLKPLYFNFRPLHKQMGQFNYQDARIAEERGEINGISCIIVRETSESSPQHELWLEPERDYALRRYQAYLDGKLYFRLTVLGDREEPGFGPVPTAWDTETWVSEKLANSSQFRVQSISLNEPIADKEFTHVPGPGTYVSDHVRGESYLISETGEKTQRPYHGGPPEKKATASLAMNPETGERGFRTWWLVIGVVVVTSLALILWTRGVFRSGGR
jgi:hypothetical protein